MTAVGMARLGAASGLVVAVPLELPAVLLLPLPFVVAAAVPFTPLLASVVFVDDDDDVLLFVIVVLFVGEGEEEEEVAAAVSRRTSSSTRLMSAGNVLTSPDRSRAMAWDCMAAGQLELCASREWRRCSWIL
jgi:hypothetical protein